MAKRRESGFEILASVPWPLAVGCGVAAYLGFRYGVSWYLGSVGNPLTRAWAAQSESPFLAMLAWVMLGFCLLAALICFLKRRRRHALLRAQDSMQSLRALPWQEFELLAGEAFRRQGYAVQETGQGGPDGGVDLRLRRKGQLTLVQCKQWRSQQVGVRQVREMFGIMTAEGAHAVKIVALGDYTPDARRFAQGKPIELVDGCALLASVQAIQAQAEAPRLLDRPAVFASTALACLLLALAMPGVMRVLKPAAPTGLAAAQADALAPLPPPVSLLPQAAAQPRQAPADDLAQVPMSEQEQRGWERKNREAMKILEPTTPELASPPAQ